MLLSVPGALLMPDSGFHLESMSKYSLFHDGYGNSHAIQYSEDIRAVYAAADFRYAPENRDKENDRNWASYVINVGADYYPAGIRQ
jgi:hypothetical protein